MVRETLHIKTDTGRGENDPAFHGIEITEYSLQATRMGMPALTATVMYGTCLDKEWTGSEYVVLRGERYYIRDTPSSSKDNTDMRYKHEIVFKPERAEKLANVYFEDVVPSWSETKDKPCSNNSRFTFYGTIAEFLDRLNCAFLKAGIGDSILSEKTSLTTLDKPVGDGYCAMLDPNGGYDTTETKNVSFEDTYLWDAIAQGYEIFGIPFEFRSMAMVWGAAPKVVDYTFKYGYDNSLLSVTKNNANARIINRVTFKGSSENLTYFYPNEEEYPNTRLVFSDGSALNDANTKIADIRLLYARIAQDTPVTLEKEVVEPKTVKVSESNFDVNLAKVVSASSGLEVEGEMSTDNDGDGYFGTSKKRYHFEGYNVRRGYFYIKVNFDFTMSETDFYKIDHLDGMIWLPQMPELNGGIGGNLIAGNADDLVGSPNGAYVMDLYKYNENGTADKQLSDIKQVNGCFDLGEQKAGRYRADITLKIESTTSNPTIPLIRARLILNYATISNDTAERSETYRWRQGANTFASASAFGVSVTLGDMDAAVGSSLQWTSDGHLMPMQTNLMPPKYRETLGAERFYNAKNDTYTDPDTGKPYKFTNEYEDGDPREYIYVNENIKPTIKGITNSLGQPFDELADVAFDQNDSDAAAPDQNGDMAYAHSFFYVRLNIFDGPYGFDLFKAVSQSQEMKIQMTSGPCNGCKFKVQGIEFTDGDGAAYYANPVQVIPETGAIVAGDYDSKIDKTNIQPSQQDTTRHSVWIALQKDEGTFGTIMPSAANNYRPKAGDTFNITGIDLPVGYIKAAEQRGMEEAIRFMADNNEEKFTFDIQASRIFFAENPDVLAQLDEYSKIKVEYDDKVVEQYVTGITIECRDSDVLPDVKITLADTVAVGESFAQSVAERALSLIGNAGTYSGTSGGNYLTADVAEQTYLSKRDAEQKYLNKQGNDRTRYKLSTDTAFEVGGFVSGVSGGIFYRDPETGQTYIEADRLKIRMKAIFETLTIAHVDSIGGKMMITPGGAITITLVEKVYDESGGLSGYRCYFKSKDETEGADCRFAVGDEAYSEQFNISAGTTYNASNNFYWRLVTAVDNDNAFVVLSATDCAEGSGEPKAGDTIGQLGNRTDKTRQSAIILSTVDAFAPCVTLYNGIDSYSLVDKSVVEYGVDKTKNPPEPFFHCYGSFFFGPRDKKSYLQFEPSVGTLVFKGKLEVTSTIGDKTFEEYIKDVVPPVTQEDIEVYVNAIVDPKIEGIQNQIDGVIETWFYNGVPTLTNYPASGWDTEALKEQHLSDLYFDNDTGLAYRFSKDENGNYFWNDKVDSATAKALADAQRAQDTADGKRRVFTSQPVPPYDKGDLWANATYGEQYSNDLLRCVTPKAKGAAFAISDWMPASKYTDDTALNEFIVDYEKNIKDIQAQLDGKAQTWHQQSDPSTAWTTDDEKAVHKGDLWYNTTDGTTWYWNGSAWEKQNVPNSVFDAIDGKADIFVSKPASYKQNDLWFLEADYTLSGIAYKAGTLVVAKRDMGNAWSADDWIKKDRYTDDTVANQALQRFAAWAADGVFAPTELAELELELKRIAGDKSGIDAQYQRYADVVGKVTGLAAAKTAYDDAYDAYKRAIDGILNATPDADGCIPVPADFESRITAYYDARANISGLLTEAAKAYTANQVAEYDYLKAALEQDTVISGGLVMSSLISLGVTNPDDPANRETWAGMNGIYVDGKSIASWWGGPMADKFATPQPAKYAAALVRMDGSAYWANGNIGFNADGSGWLGNETSGIRFATDGSMTFGNGIKININGSDEGLRETLETVLSYVTGIDSVLIPVDSQGNRVAWSSPSLYAVKSLKGFYSDSFVSAKGLSADGGTGGMGTSELRLLDDVALSNPARGQALVYDGTKWTNQSVATGLDEDSLAAYLTANNYAKKSDIPSLTGYATQEWVVNRGYLTAAALNGYATQSWVQQNYLGYIALDGGLVAVNHATDWGNQGGTQVAEWGDNTGGNFKFRKNNPEAGKISLLIDGTVYIDEGLNAVASQSWVTGRGYITSSALANYVTLDTSQVISGFKEFTNAIQINGSVDQLPYLRLHISGVSYCKLRMDRAGNLHLLDGGSESYSKSFKARAFIKAGGASNQVLMADGSVQTHWKAADVTDATSDEGMITPLAMNQWVGRNFVPWSRQTVATVNGTNHTPQIFNIENENLIAGYQNFWSVINIGSYSGNHFRSQIAMPYQGSISDTDMFIRTASGTTWRAWRRVLHDGNYSGILDGRYYTESEVNSKLSGYLPRSGGSMTSTGLVTNLNADLLDGLHGNSYFKRQGRLGSYNIDTLTEFATRDIQPASEETIEGTKPFNNWGTLLTFKSLTDNGGIQIAGGNSRLYYRQRYNATFKSVAWNVVANLSDLAWANIANKPTTLAGYGVQTEADSLYVNTAGDTMTGLLISADILIPVGKYIYGKVVETNGAMLQHDGDRTIIGSVGASTTKATHLRSKTGHLTVGSTSTASYTVWDSGNDGANSGLDADKVDGAHLVNLNYCPNSAISGSQDGITTAQFIEKLKNAGAFNYRHWTTKCSWSYAGHSIITDSGHGRIQLAGAVIEVWSLNQNEYTVKITTSPTTTDGVRNAVFIYRNHGANYAPNWKRLANTTDNVASATKLQTARSIWGQSFDGEANVSGNMTGVGTIYLQGTAGNFCEGIRIKPYIDWSTIVLGGNDLTANSGTSANSWSLHNHNGIFCINRNGSTNHTGYELCNIGGNWGIGTTSPAYKLDVNGDIHSYGIISNSNSTGNSTAINYGGVELIHTSPYIDFHYGRSTADFTARIIADEANSLHILGSSNFKLKIGNGYIQWDSSRAMFHFSHGIYSDGQVTAKGVGSTTASASKADSGSGQPSVGTLSATDATTESASELESLRLRVAQLEQRLDAMTA